jgi:hypothetical protein
MSKFRLTILESERGWGSKREYEYFETYDDALERKRFINSSNVEKQAPDWYMIAEDIEELKLAVDQWVTS